MNSLIEEHAREKAGMPEGWRVWLWKRMPPGGPETLYFDLTGVVPGVFRRGPRKGETNWKPKDRSTERNVIIPADEHRAWVKAWSDRTGLCPDCTGDGRRVRSAGVGGTTYRPCPSCDGSGKAKAEVTA